MSKKTKINRYYVEPSWEINAAEVYTSTSPEEAVKAIMAKQEWELDPGDHFEVFQLVPCGRYTAGKTYEVKKLPETKA